MEQLECLYDRYIKDFRCKYYMTKTTKRFIDNTDTINCFGVKIEKISTNGKLLSTACVKDVGINENDVKSFIKKLNDGKVTPITLKDIITDRQMQL